MPARQPLTPIARQTEEPAAGDVSLLPSHWNQFSSRLRAWRFEVPHPSPPKDSSGTAGNLSRGSPPLSNKYLTLFFIGSDWGRALSFLSMIVDTVPSQAHLWAWEQCLRGVCRIPLPGVCSKRSIRTTTLQTHPSVSASTKIMLMGG